MARNSTKKKQLFIQVQVQQQQQQPLVQQQHGQRVAKSIEKELERNQYEKDRKSTGSSKASRKQPPPPPPPKMSSLIASASALTTQQRLMWQHQQPQLVQQQQQMRAKSLEKELEPEPSMRQYIKDNPTPESIAEEKKNNSKVSAASVHELLYKDPIDYTVNILSMHLNHIDHY